MDPIESKNEEIIGDFVHDGDPVTDEHNTIRIEDGVIRKEERNVIRFFSCGHPSSLGIGGRCSAKSCDAIVCKNCYRACNRCLKNLCNVHQKLKDRRPYCKRCFWVVFLFGRW